MAKATNNPLENQGESSPQENSLSILDAVRVAMALTAELGKVLTNDYASAEHAQIFEIKNSKALLTLGRNKIFLSEGQTVQVVENIDGEFDIYRIIDNEAELIFTCERNFDGYIQFKQKNRFLKTLVSLRSRAFIVALEGSNLCLYTLQYADNYAFIPEI